MKNLIYFLLFSSSVGFSQTLIDNIYIMSVHDNENKTHKSTKITSNMSIYVEDNFLHIKDDIEHTKYKIQRTTTEKIVEDNAIVNVYHVLIDNKIHFASIFTDKKRKVLLLECSENKDFTMFYEKRIL